MTKLHPRHVAVHALITSKWAVPTTKRRRKMPVFTPATDAEYSFLVGTNDRGEGYFIIMDDNGEMGSLDVTTFSQVLRDAKKANLVPPFHVYARYEILQSPNVLFTKTTAKDLAS